jgi:hypothetical protein
MPEPHFFFVCINLAILLFPLSLSVSRSLSLSLSVCFCLGWHFTRVPPYERRPFPSKENRQILERDYLGPPVVPGGQEIGLGSRNLRPRAEARPTRAVSNGRLDEGAAR